MYKPGTEVRGFVVHRSFSGLKMLVSHLVPYEAARNDDKNDTSVRGVPSVQYSTLPLAWGTVS